MRRRITDGTGNSACAERSTRSPSHSSTNTVFLNVMTIARATLTVPSGSYVWFSNKTLPLSAITRHLLSCWFSGARGENRTHEYRICSPVPLPLGDARELERKERFELSSRVWKTRMFPATSLPRRIIATKNLVGEDRVELSPRVPRTRMRTLHHTPKLELVRQVRLELTLPCLRGRCLDPIWLLTHGGTERTRTVIDLIDNQAPHPSATVPLREFGWVEGS